MKTGSKDFNPLLPSKINIFQSIHRPLQTSHLEISVNDSLVVKNCNRQQSSSQNLHTNRLARTESKALRSTSLQSMEFSHRKQLLQRFLFERSRDTCMHESDLQGTSSACTRHAHTCLHKFVLIYTTPPGILTGCESVTPRVFASTGDIPPPLKMCTRTNRRRREERRTVGLARERQGEEQTEVRMGVLETTVEGKHISVMGRQSNCKLHHQTSLDVLSSPHHQTSAYVSFPPQVNIL